MKIVFQIKLFHIKFPIIKIPKKLFSKLRKKQNTMPMNKKNYTKKNDTQFQGRI